MNTFLPYLIVFLVGALFSVTELINIRYRKISSFLLSSFAFYGYAIVFGLFAVLIQALLNNSIISNDVSFFGIGENPALQAVIVGMFTKSFFDLKIFSLSIGNDKTFPVGIKTISQFIEEPLMSRMEIDWFKNYSKFISKVNEKYKNSTLADIHNLAVDKLQNFPDQQRVIAFLKGEFDKVTEKKDKFSLIMREFGKNVFCQVFEC